MTSLKVNNFIHSLSYDNSPEPQADPFSHEQLSNFKEISKFSELKAFQQLVF